MEFVTAVNRSSRPLKATWDGKRYDFAPHQKLSLPSIVARAAKLQNPIMGSEDLTTMGINGFPHMEYLIGVEEWNDDCSSVEQTDAVEKADRRTLVGALPTEVITPKGGGLYTNVPKSTLPLDSSFVNPKS